MGLCSFQVPLLLLAGLLFVDGIEIENVGELVHYFFDICRGKALTRIDLDRCIASTPSDFSVRFMGGLDAKAFMVVVDLNRDGTITPEEYESALTEEEDDRGREKIEVKDRHGNTKFMSPDDLLRSMRAEHEGVRMEDGRLTKRTEGSSTVSEITKENPDLARFIAMGRWCGMMLERAGHELGAVVGLSSSTAPDGDEEEDEDEEFEVDREADKGRQRHRKAIHMNMREFKQWIQIEFKPKDVQDRQMQDKEEGKNRDKNKEMLEKKAKKIKKKEKNRRNFVKVLLVRDPVHIPDPPHLSIERAVLLNTRGGVQSVLTLPSAPTHATQPSQEDLDVQSALWRISLAVIASSLVTLTCLRAMGRSLSDLWLGSEDKRDKED